MKQVMNSVLKAKQIEKYRAAVLRMELDYELATLFDAINENDKQKKAQCKQKLEKIRKELINLAVL